MDECREGAEGEEIVAEEYFEPLRFANVEARLSFVVARLRLVENGFPIEPRGFAPLVTLAHQMKLTRKMLRIMLRLCMQAA